MATIYEMPMKDLITKRYALQHKIGEARKVWDEMFLVQYKDLLDEDKMLSETIMVRLGAK